MSAHNGRHVSSESVLFWLPFACDIYEAQLRIWRARRRQPERGQARQPARYVHNMQVIFTFDAALMVVGVARVPLSVVPASTLVGAMWLVLLGALVGRMSCSCFVLCVCLRVSAHVFSVSSGLYLLPCIALYLGCVGFVLSGWACPFWRLCCSAFRPSLYVTTYYIDLQKETEEKARQPETKLSATTYYMQVAGATRPCVGRARTSRRVPLAGPRCAVSPGPRLKLFRPVSHTVRGFGVCGSASLCGA
jgi:hypothetical protein